MLIALPPFFPVYHISPERKILILSPAGAECAVQLAFFTAVQPLSQRKAKAENALLF
jgi:hypothetical protein